MMKRERYTRGRPLLGNRILTPIRPYRTVKPLILINRYHDPPTLVYDRKEEYTRHPAAAAEQY